MLLSPAELQSLVVQMGSVVRVADHLGRNESTIRSAIKRGTSVRVADLIRTASALEVEIAALKLERAQKPPVRTRIIPAREGRSTRVLAIGDTHDEPHIPKDRFKWIGRHCVARMPDRVVQIGDFASWNSVSEHEEKGSVSHAKRPSFQEDLRSCEEAMTEFYKQTSGLNIPLELVCGNHEHRIQRFEDKTPETVGTLSAQFDDLCARYRWRVHPYGQWLMIDSVGFVHVPMNIMGRPYGGQTSENQIANHATHSIVFGHTHRCTFRKTPKIGANNAIEIMNLGSAMPNGYVAKYAGTATTGWSYGIYELEIRAGHIVSHTFVSMSQLEELYS